MAPETDPFWRFLATEIDKKDQLLTLKIAKNVWRTYIHFAMTRLALMSDGNENVQKNSIFQME